MIKGYEDPISPKSEWTGRLIDGRRKRMISINPKHPAWLILAILIAILLGYLIGRTP